MTPAKRSEMWLRLASARISAENWARPLIEHPERLTPEDARCYGVQAAHYARLALDAYETLRSDGDRLIRRDLGEGGITLALQQAVMGYAEDGWATARRYAAALSACEHERDEARAEVARLRAENEEVLALLDALLGGRDA